MGILGAIAGALPDWLLSLLVAVLLWYGVNYIWLAPAYFEEKMTGGLRGQSYEENYNDCSSEKYYKNSDEYINDMAIYTASLGFFGSERSLIRKICADE